MPPKKKTTAAVAADNAKASTSADAGNPLHEKVAAHLGVDADQVLSAREYDDHVVAVVQDETTVVKHTIPRGDA